MIAQALAPVRYTATTPQTPPTAFRPTVGHVLSAVATLVCFTWAAGEYYLNNQIGPDAPPCIRNWNMKSLYLAVQSWRRFPPTNDFEAFCLLSRFAFATCANTAGLSKNVLSATIQTAILPFVLFNATTRFNSARNAWKLCGITFLSIPYSMTVFLGRPDLAGNFIDSIVHRNY